MALTDEQRAMLQLLLEGGQGYEDIGSLLGVPDDEVRSRARSALGEIAGADPDAKVALSDYLLGQADPIGRADAVRHLQSDPEANALAERLVSQLRVLAPKAQLPEVPPPRGRRRATPAPPPAAPVAEPEPPAATAPAPAAAGAEGPRRSLSARVSGALSRLGSVRPRDSRAAFGIGTGLLLVVVLVLAVSGAFGGGDGGGDDCETIDASAAEQAGVPVLQLDAPEGAPQRDGCSPTGQVVFSQAGRGNNAQIVLQTNLGNLPATGSDQTYIVWLYASDQVAFPLAQDVAGEDGSLSGAAPIPTQLLPALGSFREVRVSLTTTSEAQDAIAQARQQRSLPAFLGETVLTGTLPGLGGQGGAQGQQGAGGQGGQGGAQGQEGGAQGGAQAQGGGAGTQ